MTVRRTVVPDDITRTVRVVHGRGHVYRSASLDRFDSRGALVGANCTAPDAVFIEDTVIFLPFGKATDKPKAESLQDAGETSSNPEPALETGH